MEYRIFQKEQVGDVVALLNRSFGGELPYRPFTERSFAEKFLEQPDFSLDGTFVALEKGKVVGFANGIFCKNPIQGQSFADAPGYVTLVIVDQVCRRKGVGSALLDHVEQYLKKNGKKTIEIKFFNPINLEWIIPGTVNHTHPNAPGVLLDSPAYSFFVKRKYIKESTEVSMHLDLKGFEIPQKYKDRLQNLAESGITIETYDSRKHSGFDQLFDGLKNEYWRKDIKDNLALDKPLPILVASDKGRICGYAGPITVEESGRGWFAGIGVAPDHEGHGIGTLLFLMLMRSFQELGAGFSTLFTGIDNPARKIYERTGFQIVTKWAVMKKEVI